MKSGPQIKITNGRPSPAPVFLAFLAMGFGDAAGLFVSLAKETFQLSNFTAQTIAFTGFAMFGLLSVPVGLYQQKKGKKRMLVTGLVTMLTGLLIPIVAPPIFSLFLLSVALLGAGAAFLTVVANPLMREISDPEKYSRNLSLGQFAKACGSLAGPLVPFIGTRYFHLSWQVMFPVFAIMVLIALISTLKLKIPPEPQSSQSGPFLGQMFGLLRTPFVSMMVLAVCLDAAAEVTIAANVPLILEERFGLPIAETGILGSGAFFISMALGRLLGGVILNWILPKHLLIASCLIAGVGLMMSLSTSLLVCGLGIAVTGIGFGNLFPLLFSIAIGRLHEQGNLLSGLMSTAILGGALGPLCAGGAIELFGTTLAALLVPGVAALFILFVALGIRPQQG